MSTMDAKRTRTSIDKDAMVYRVECGGNIQRQKNCRQAIARKHNVIDDLQQRGFNEEWF